MPKVSVVLPNYNYARYLDERIQSLLNQTYTDFELIITDDASTDNSLEVISRYTSDPRIQTLFFEKNSGLAYQRWNDGANLAQGEYILFAGADDSCDPRLLARLVEQLDANPTVGIAYCQSLEIDGEGKTIRSLNIHTKDLNKDHWQKDYVSKGKDECRYIIIRNIIPNASAALIRRQLFEDLGRFDEQLKLVADWMLWGKIFLVSDVAFVAEPLNYFRKHQKTVRSSSQKEGLHVLEEIKVVSFLTQNAEISSSFVNRAHNRIVHRWVNSTARLIISNPGKALERFKETHKMLIKVDPMVNRRLLQRIVVDISTLGLVTLKERTYLR